MNLRLNGRDCPPPFVRRRAEATEQQSQLPDISVVSQCTPLFINGGSNDIVRRITRNLTDQSASFEISTIVLILTNAFYPALCAVTDVTESHVAHAEACESFRCEYIVHETVVSECVENTVVINYDAAAFLTSVLKCEKTVINGGCNVNRFL